MKILVTGGNGQLGRSLQKIAAEYPAHEFYFCDLPEGDITDKVKMSLLIARTGPDVVVNCAAYTAVDRAESDPSAAGEVNSCGPGILAALVRESGLKMVHISTDYVFDGKGVRPYAENDKVDPQGVYGRSKLAGEREIENCGTDAAIIRTSWLYSEFGNNFVKTMLKLAEEGREINVVDDQTGCPTYAEDLARAIIQLIEYGINGTQVYHYSGEGATTWYEFGVEIFRQAGIGASIKGISTKEYDSPAPRPAYSVLDTQKIRSLGITVRPWEAALAGCLRELGRKR